MKIIYKTIIQFIVLASVLSIVVAGAQALIEFDLANLRAQSELAAKAYDNIHIQDAWKFILARSSSSPVVIGIIDSGVDINHQEFNSPKVDFGSSPSSTLIDFFASGHGTQVAGIIGANNVLGAGFSLPDNSSQMNGIISGFVRENNYKFELENLPTSTATSTQSITVYTALQNLLTRSPAVVNLSFGLLKCSAITPERRQLLNLEECYKNDAEFDDAARDYVKIFNSSDNQDTLFVTIAHNWDIDTRLKVLPATIQLPNLITVGATDLDDKRAEFDLISGKGSNFGTDVHISAPGKNIYAPRPGNEYNILFQTDSIVSGGISGTSFAAPMVTGVAAILKSIKPELTPAEIKGILIRTADLIFTDDPDEIAKTLGTGCITGTPPPNFRGCRLNALKAIQELLIPPPPPPTATIWPQFQHDARHTGQSSFTGPATSTIKWSFIPPTSTLPLSGGFLNTPVVGPDGTIYIGAGTQSNGNLFALNPDGSTKWTSPDLPASPSTPAIVTDGFVIIVSGTEDFGADISAFDSQTGNLLWIHPVNEKVNFITAAPDNTLYFTNENGVLFSLTPSLSGAVENWQVDLGPISLVASSPAVGLDNTVYVIDPQGIIFARNSSDGSSKWARNLAENLAPSALILNNGVIAVSSGSRLEGLNPADGSTVFSIPYPVQGDAGLPILLKNGKIGVILRHPVTKQGFLLRIDSVSETVDIPLSLGTFSGGFRAPVTDNDNNVYLGFNSGAAILAGSRIRGFSSTNTPILNLDFVPGLLISNFAISDQTLYAAVVEGTFGEIFRLVAVGEE